MDVILSALWDKGFDEAMLFVASVRKYAPDAHLIMYVLNIPDQQVNALFNVGVDVRSLGTLGPPKYGLNCWRVKVWQDYLRRNECDRVMLTDTRDVILQGNPFDWFASDAVYAFQESQLIMLSDWNRMWVRDNYGAAGQEEVETNPIICSGVLLGGRRAMMDYLDHVVGVYETARNKTEQGVLNYLYWSGRLKSIPVRAIENGYPVLTLGFVRQDEVDFDQDQKLHMIGQPPALVVHQYDRHQLGDRLKSALALT